MKEEKDKIEELTKEDYRLIKEFINMSAKKGAIEGKGLFLAGYLYNKIEKLCQ